MTESEESDDAILSKGRSLFSSQDQVLRNQSVGKR